MLRRTCTPGCAGRPLSTSLSRITHPAAGCAGRALSTSLSRITYPAAPPLGKHSGRLMDASIWPKIAPIWPSSMHFPHDVSTLHEEDEVHDLPVGDARALAPQLDTHGFELIHAPTGALDFDDERQVGDAYMEQTRALVEAATGAALVVPFHHVQIDTRRDKFGKRGGAVERVHGDYTQSSGPRMLQELVGRGVVPARTRGMRGAILNVWRSVDAHAPVLDKPLALLDVRSVDASRLGVYYLVEGGDGLAERRMGQNLALPYDPSHAWYYFPKMVRDEALVFFTYDGRTPDEPRFTFHCAFDPPQWTEDAPARRAVIVRVAAFFEAP